MNRNIVIALITFGFIGNACVSLAKENNSLPPAGLTPSNFFYFFDRIGEGIQEFFTFRPQKKALLKLQFAAERISEIKLELEVRGPEAGGVGVARERLTKHIEDANVILKQEEEKGEDTQEAEEEFDSGLQSLLQTAGEENSNELDEEIEKMEQELSDDFAKKQEEELLEELENLKDIDGGDEAGQSYESDIDDQLELLED